MFQIKICAKQQILIDGLYKKGWRLRLQSTVTSDGGEHNQQWLQMVVSKSLETISGMKLNQLQP